MQHPRARTRADPLALTFYRQEFDFFNEIMFRKKTLESQLARSSVRTSSRRSSLAELTSFGGGWRLNEWRQVDLAIFRLKQLKRDCLRVALCLMG